MPSKKKPVTAATTGTEGRSDTAARRSVTEYCTPERRAAVPKRFKLTVPEPKGHHGLCIGRDEELEQIHGYFATQYRAEDQGLLHEDDCVACIITNAPGSGKTTLREEFARQAKKRDIACIELTPGALTDPGRFVRAIIHYAAREPSPDSPTDTTTGAKVRARLRKLTRKVKRLVPGLAAVAAGTTADLLVPSTGGFVGWVTAKTLERKNRLAERLIEAIGDDAVPVDEVLALQLLTETHEAQYLLTVDEAHTWADQGVNRDGLHAMLSMIGNPSAREENGIRGGGLLLSGLGNVKDNLDGLGLSRAAIIWMGELTEAHSQKIIHHAIDELPEKRLPKGRRKRVLATWPKELAGAFTHWPQHAAVAGQIAKAMILQTPKATVADDRNHLEWTKTKTAEAIVALYTTQLGNAVRDGDPRAPRILAAAAQLSGGVLTVDTVDEIITRCRARKGLPVEPPDIKHTIGMLKRAGMLRDERVWGPHGQIDQYRIGIPSLTDYTLNGLSERQRQAAMATATEILAETAD